MKVQREAKRKETERVGSRMRVDDIQKALSDLKSAEIAAGDADYPEASAGMRNLCSIMHVGNGGVDDEDVWDEIHQTIRDGGYMYGEIGMRAFEKDGGAVIVSDGRTC